MIPQVQVGKKTFITQKKVLRFAYLLIKKMGICFCFFWCLAILPRYKGQFPALVLKNSPMLWKKLFFFEKKTNLGHLKKIIFFQFTLRHRNQHYLISLTYSWQDLNRRVARAIVSRKKKKVIIIIRKSIFLKKNFFWAIFLDQKSFFFKFRSGSRGRKQFI